ncbi:MAG: hypothetical protein HY399_04975 [Elusimicrobia bacterium]|nr:hypothetical protein [Elusimicrobiota bacterium]
MAQITTVRLPDDLRKKLKLRAHLEHRSLSNQIETSLRMALAAEENSDLPLQFIKDILEARAEKEAGMARHFRI